jgi:adenine deaminase
VLAKIYETYRVRGYKKLPPIIDGHAPGLSGVELSAYINAGIMADHECSSGEELEERLRKGMFVMVRNGSSAKNAEALLEHVIANSIDPRRLMFCSDDRNPFDLLRHGHIDQTLALGARLARESGGRLRLIDVIRMATLTPAEFFHMAYRGRVGIGTRADLAVVDDLETFRVHLTIRNGDLVARDGALVDDVEDYPYHSYMLQSVKLAREFRADDFRIHSPTTNPRARVIRMIPGQLLTEQFVEPLSAPRGVVEPDVGGDVLKLAVLERHGKNGGFAVGFVRGFGIKHGAMATTIGHDSHNLGVIGTNDEDMAHAVRELARLQGGVVAARDGKTIAALPLRVGGLMSTEPPEQVVAGKTAVYDAYKELGGTLKDPVVAMSFLQLPVIPELKMSDKGLVEMGAAGPRLVPLFAD